ncbi:hypothetical protein IO476_001420 [Campylobacter coli]|nr:hypothetical protein [Campylobacter coli]
MQNIAVIILSCKDYESLEISLANFMENTPPYIDFFILQNGKGTYNKDKSHKVALRYKNLYPKRIQVIDWILEQDPLNAIKTLLQNKIMEKYTHICKCDDDTFPVTKDWIEKLAHSYLANKEKFGSQLAFTLPLVNNNPWGFKKTVELMNLKKEYDDNIGRIHYAGCEGDFSLSKKYFPLKIYQKDEIFENGFGTIWRYPYIARWIHQKTTLNVDHWIESIINTPNEIFDNKLRYSINCMFFEKKYWINLQGHDDESFIHELAIKNNHKIIACPSVPFVHLFFFSQREENKDLIPIIRSYYQNRLQINYPISIHIDKLYDLEERLQYLEENFFKKNINKNSIKKIRYKFLYPMIHKLSLGLLYKNKLHKF